VLPRFRKSISLRFKLHLLSLHCLGDYERIFDGTRHKRLTESLAAAYLDIITLCTQFRKTLRGQKVSNVRRIFKPLSLDRHLDEAVERFCRHREKVEAEARACDMIEAAEERKAQLILLTAERRRKLLSNFLTQAIVIDTKSFSNSGPGIRLV
jgi:hypothetical protein